MNIIDIINKKKNKKELTAFELEYVINGHIKGIIPEYQISSILMAIWFNGLSERETNDLTMIMAESGKILDLNKIPGIKVDKHSTGGVGDKTTLALLPLIGSAGVPFPKISGRGLGHTGGTIDKLESISGFQTNLKISKFIENVRKINASIINASNNIVPADKKIYSLRDVTGTIDSIPLIASSIMSKKIAGGADAIVLNVTVGKGAFLKKIDDAILLGEIMSNIGKKNNKDTFVIISSMNQPLGYSVGNSLEVEEAINLLKNKGPEDLKEICLFIGSHMLIAGGIVSSCPEVIEILKNKIENGQALEKLKQIVKMQMGDIKQIDDTCLLSKTKYQRKVYSEKKGYIKSIDAYKIGKASMILGAGREKKDDKIDLAVGIVLNKKEGDYISLKQNFATLYYNDERKSLVAHNIVKNAFSVSDEKPVKKPLILATIDKKGFKIFY
ncbi:MAG: thymidine phosphorylase [Atribacterota bacterium]|nr:thymidine phosphorylase [Atribacterota bacterium]